MKFFRRPTVWAVLVIAVIAAAMALWRARGPSVPVAIAARRDLEQHLVVTGRVLAWARVEAASLTTGQVLVVAVREGDKVKTGELLVQLDDAEASAAVTQAEAVVAQAQLRAEQIKTVAAVVAGSSFSQAQANLDFAQQQYDRARTLVTSGAAPQQQLEDAHRALDVARSQQVAAGAQAAGSSAMGVDARSAFAALAVAKAQLAATKIRYAQTRILALQDGIVLTRQVEPGDVVTPAKSLVSLAVAGDTRLSIQPDERDLAYVHVGLKARASADAFPQESFEAEVTYVAPSIELQRGTVEVRLRVASPPAYLRPDMTVSVDLSVASKRSALVVPFEAVRGLATPRPWALAVVGGRTERRDLTLGIRGDGAVEVLTGLVEGDSVVLPDGQRLEAGKRVRAFSQSAKTAKE
jgi:HlyD family secretion protein